MLVYIGIFEQIIIHKYIQSQLQIQTILKANNNTKNVRTLEQLLRLDS